jgi:hypothetical protein
MWGRKPRCLAEFGGLTGEDDEKHREVYRKEAAGET